MSDLTSRDPHPDSHQMSNGKTRAELAAEKALADAIQACPPPSEENMAGAQNDAPALPPPPPADAPESPAAPSAGAVEAANPSADAPAA